MARTNYGKREKGDSKFVIVAPHAAGDDLRTQELAEEIARLLNASVVINDVYVQPRHGSSSTRGRSYRRTSSRAYKNPYIEDFNKLPWSDERHEYLWGKKHPHMKEFYEHIKEFAEDARENGNGKAIIVYIHGMDDDGTNLGIDIGFGAKYLDEKFKSAQEHSPAHDNNGEIRANPEDIVKLKTILAEKLKTDYAIKVGIGERYAAWSRQNGIQYHAGTPDYSFQLEISSFLRKPARIKYTAKLIADALKEVYK